MRIRWSPRARRDLLEIRRYISRDSPRAARRWVDRLVERAEAAAEMPHSGRVVAELEDPDVREVLLGRYRIVYRVLETSLEVLTVFDGSRLLLPDRVFEAAVPYG